MVFIESAGAGAIVEVDAVRNADSAERYTCKGSIFSQAASMMMAINIPDPNFMSLFMIFLFNLCSAYCLVTVKVPA
jgi:hypothetical protein